ncbi:hypothetical protein BESB_079840 [Besnoitia besnoiti]|uniref:Protein HGH1 C-terminal domain-containing protein n=1 Tax=Besnoitia besnoiti TaxID=94643 RepID=A0A2A9M5L6_BESBE|nr:hypothetical protein BESB_079840 [Besnoitia besnoiti]PFH33768.1 hypothetical protein BESB_079840 [Besnoitia besnoiti]
MEPHTSCSDEEVSLYGDLLELLQHSRRRDVRTQALHACVQCSSHPSFLGFLRSLLSKQAPVGGKREASEPKEAAERKENLSLHPREDLKRFVLSLLRSLGREEDGASAAAVEVLINLSADDVLADYLVRRELHATDLVVDNLEEQTKNNAPRHANISLMLLTNLTRKEEASLALLESKHGVPGFNLVRLIRVLDAAARHPARKSRTDSYWQEEGYFILSILQNVSSLKEGREKLSGDLLPQLNAILSLLPLLPPACHAPMLRLCLNHCLDKGLHAAICAFPPPSFSSSLAARPASPTATDEPASSVPPSPTSTRDSTVPPNSPPLSPSSPASPSAASASRGDRERDPAENGYGPALPCSLLLALACFLYPPKGPRRAYPGEENAQQPGRDSEKREQTQAPSEGAVPFSAGAGETETPRQEPAAAGEQSAGGERSNAAEEKRVQTDAELARLRFLHPVVSRDAYGPAGSVLSRKLVVDCLAALALTETGRVSMRESGIYEVLRCVHLLEDKNSPVREEIENMVHVLVYSEEELKQQDEDLARSAQRAERQGGDLLSLENNEKRALTDEA